MQHLKQGRIHASLHPRYTLLSDVHAGKPYNISCLSTNLQDAEQKHSLTAYSQGLQQQLWC